MNQLRKRWKHAHEWDKEKMEWQEEMRKQQAAKQTAKQTAKQNAKQAEGLAVIAEVKK
jgi:hypothetical protein